MTEKIVSVNSLSALQAMKFWLRREKYRHLQDIERIEADLEKLDDIEIPDGLDVTAFYEIERKP